MFRKKARKAHKLHFWAYPDWELTERLLVPDKKRLKIKGPLGVRSQTCEQQRVSN